MYSYFFSVNFARDAVDVMWFVLSSTFMLTVVTALIGAGGGALIAERIAANKEVFRQKQDELLSVQRALAMTVGILNAYLALKSQQLDRTATQYLLERERVRLLKEAGPRFPGDEISTQLDLADLMLPVTPHSQLQELLNRRVMLVEKQQLYASQVVMSIANLDGALSKRTEAITRFRATDWPNKEAQVDSYFGFPDADGNIDAYFHTSIEGMASYANNVVAFARMLMDALIVRGKTIKAQTKDTEHSLLAIDFDNLETDAELPVMDEYSLWLEEIAVDEPSTTNIVERAYRKIGEFLKTSQS